MARARPAEHRSGGAEAVLDARKRELAKPRREQVELDEHAVMAAVRRLVLLERGEDHHAVGWRALDGHRLEVLVERYPSPSAVHAAGYRRVAIAREGASVGQSGDVLLEGAPLLHGDLVDVLEPAVGVFPAKVDVQMDDELGRRVVLRPAAGRRLEVIPTAGLLVRFLGRWPSG